MVQKNPGGGGMSKKVEVGQRTGSASKATSPEAAAQIGIKTAFQKKPIESGRGYDGARYGNEIALNAAGTKAGPGAGRTTYKCGTQSLYGSVNPGHTAPATDILSKYGPERKT